MSDNPKELISEQSRYWKEGERRAGLFLSNALNKDYPVMVRFGQFLAAVRAAKQSNKNKLKMIELKRKYNL